MRRIIVYAICTLGVLGCVYPKYKIRVASTTPDTKVYTPMQKKKLVQDWQEGTPVFSESEAQYQVRDWQKANAFERRAQRAAYIKVKRIKP
jgi:hypothetical protein